MTRRARQKEEVKIDFSILSRQRRVFHQEGITDIKITVGDAEAKRFREAQLMAANQRRPFFTQLPKDIGLKHMNLSATPPVQSSLNVYLWYCRTKAAHLITEM